MQNGEKNAPKMSLQTLNSEYMKSAEAITYDDDGNIIPLDKRFDEKKVDIRFSLKEVDRYTEKEYNSGSRKRKQTSYNESETLFMQWKDSKSVSVGDTKAFKRLDKKLHFYEKTNDGCIEITKKEFDYKKFKEDSDEYDNTEVRADTDFKENESTERGYIESDAVYGYSPDGKRDAHGTKNSKLQNEQSGNLERSGSDSKTPFKVKLSLQETSDVAKAREELLKANDNLRVANTVLKNKI